MRIANALRLASTAALYIAGPLFFTMKHPARRPQEKIQFGFQFNVDCGKQDRMIGFYLIKVRI